MTTSIGGSGTTAPSAAGEGSGPGSGSKGCCAASLARSHQVPLRTHTLPSSHAHSCQTLRTRFTELDVIRPLGSVENARSDKSPCKGCGLKIDKEARRVGDHGGQYAKWQHLDCQKLLPSAPVSAPELRPRLSTSSALQHMPSEPTSYLLSQSLCPDFPSPALTSGAPCPCPASSSCPPAPALQSLPSDPCVAMCSRGRLPQVRRAVQGLGEALRQRPHAGRSLDRLRRRRQRAKEAQGQGGRG